MSPHIARGFVAQILTTDQINSLIAWESKLPEGRYLMPFEIGKHFDVSVVKTLAPEEDQAMHKTWIAFCKKHNVSQDNFMGDHQIAKDWMLYAKSCYIEPLPVPRKSWD